MSPDKAFKVIVIIFLSFTLSLLYHFSEDTKAKLSAIAENQKIINHNQSIALIQLGMKYDIVVMDSLQKVNVDTLSKAERIKFSETISSIVSRAEMRKMKLDSIQIGLK